MNEMTKPEKRTNKNGLKYNPRCTKGQATMRKKVISRWLRNGHSNAEVIEMAGEKWGLKAYTVHDYIYLIQKEWEEIYKKEKEHFAMTAIEKRHDLYVKAVKRKDFSTARNILIDIDKTTGNWEDKINIKADITFSDWVRKQSERKGLETDGDT